MTITSDILPVFHTFYSELYTSRLNYSRSHIVQYLQSIDHPTLSAVDRDFLEEPLCLEELQEAVSSMPEHKAPGSDGLSAEIFKRYGDILLPQLLDIF